MSRRVAIESYGFVLWRWIGGVSVKRSQQFKGINARFVSVIPSQADCIPANGLDINDFKILKKIFGRQHPQRILIFSDCFTAGARALVPQQLMGVFAAMAVAPLNGDPI